MADRYPLIVDSSTSTVKEIVSGDNLNLDSSKIVNTTGVGIGTAGSNELHVIGNATISGVATAKDLHATAIHATTFNEGQQAGFRNVIINGDFTVNQRRAVGTAVTVRPYYTSPKYGRVSFDYFCDRFGCQTAYDDTISGFTTTVPVSTPAGTAGLNRALRVESLSNATVGVGSTYFGTFSQPIRVQNVSKLAYGTSDAKSLTVSFWIKSNMAGTHVFRAVTAAPSGPGNVHPGYPGYRSYLTTYDIDAADTWEYKTITIPGDTVAGVGSTTFHAGFAAEDSFGLGLGWDTGSGNDARNGIGTFSSFVSPAINEWRTGNFYTANVSGRQRLVAAPGNYYEITSVQAEVGDTATPFEFIDLNTQLNRCQSYFYKIASGADEIIGSGFFESATTVTAITHFPSSLNEDVTRRYLARNVTNGYGVVGVATTAFSVFSGSEVDDTAGRVSATVVGMSAGQGCYLKTQNPDAFLAVSAEYSEPLILPAT